MDRLVEPELQDDAVALLKPSLHREEITVLRPIRNEIDALKIWRESSEDPEKLLQLLD